MATRFAERSLSMVRDGGKAMQGKTYLQSIEIHKARLKRGVQMADGVWNPRECMSID